jgi:hypothetical protein
MILNMFTTFLPCKHVASANKSSSSFDNISISVITYAMNYLELYENIIGGKKRQRESRENERILLTLESCPLWAKALHMFS